MTQPKPATRRAFLFRFISFYFLRVWIAAGLICLLAACATPPQTRALQASPPPDLAIRAELRDVVFHPQESYQCGPAALATVMDSAGVRVTPDSLVDQVYLPARQGSLQADIIAATRRHGLLAYVMEPELRNVLREVANGTPVLILQNLALSWYPKWHYAVVVAYDVERSEIVLRSGNEARQVMSLKTFEHTWARGNHWAMLALPPAKIPATVNEETFVRAAAALEQTRKTKEAQLAYKAALTRWPDNFIALIGVGNTAYVLNDKQSALIAYRNAVQRHHGHTNEADAQNNLAQTLLDLQRLDEALVAAKRAVTIGGARIAAYRATLGEIEQALENVSHKASEKPSAKSSAKQPS